MQPQQQSVFSFSKIILAGVLTFTFLSVYTYFFPQQKIEESSPTIATSQQDLDPQSLIQAQLPSVSQNNDVLLKVLAKNFDLEIDRLGRIRQVYLKDKKFVTLGQQSLIDRLLGRNKDISHLDSLPLFDLDSIRPLEVRFADPALNQKALSTDYAVLQKEIIMGDEPITIELVQNLQSLILKKKITLYPDLSYALKIEVSDPNTQYFVTNGARPIADSDSYVFLGSIIANKEQKLEKLENGDIDGIQNYKDSIFVASVDRYFASILYSKDQTFPVVINSNIQAISPISFVSLKGDGDLQGYIGPKNYQNLKALYEPLENVVEYGLISFFAKPLFLLLEILHKVCQNWGWAIVLLTIVVRLALFPLSYKGMMGMQKLKDLAPEMREIQAKYKGDPQKMQKHMMDLYRKHGANPLGGCLPLLLQIPVFFAIYKVLYGAVELKSASWILWIHDLSAIDPYYILPLVMGITMYISQALTPSNFTDPMQEKVFKLLPIFFTFFFIVFPFPAGLVLYWSVNNVISILQQMLINRVVQNQKKVKR